MLKLLTGERCLPSLMKENRPVLDSAVGVPDSEAATVLLLPPVNSELVRSVDDVTVTSLMFT